MTSDRFTIGVEEEYQLVDSGTGELRSRARAVLASDWSGEIKQEMQQNTIEVETKVCESAVEARAELERLRLQAAVAAEADGLRVVAAGTHPFSHWEGQEITPGPTYQQIRADYRRLSDTQNIFGLHVHVSLPENVDRVRVMNVVRHYLPHLLAMSASSPFYLGEDTGYASYRSILWRRWPRSGAPPRLEDEAEFRRLVDMLIRTGRIDAPGRIYWELRPHHLYPTVEFRVADVTPRLDDAFAVAGLSRVLVVGAVEGLLREPPHSVPIARSLLVENGWIASRDGTGGELVDYNLADPQPRPVIELVRELCDRLAPIARSLGEGQSMQAVEALLARGDCAARIQARNRTARSDLPEMVRWLADETVLGVGLDRRAEQRDVG